MVVPWKSSELSYISFSPNCVIPKDCPGCRVSQGGAEPAGWRKSATTASVRDISKTLSGTDPERLSEVITCDRKAQ